MSINIISFAKAEQEEYLLKKKNTKLQPTSPLLFIQNPIGPVVFEIHVLCVEKEHFACTQQVTSYNQTH